MAITSFELHKATETNRSETDVELLAKIAQGDKQSFEPLFQRHYGRLFGLVYRIVGNQQEAEDVVQEVFLRLYQRPPRRRLGQRDQNIAGWLYRVATNTAYNTIRGRQRLWQRNTHLVPPAADPQPGPESDLVEKQDQARVRAALLRLKPRQAQLLLLRQMGLSYAELAEVCEIRPTSVGKTLERAAKAFRQAYE